MYNLIFMTSKRPVKCVLALSVYGVQLCVHATCTLTLSLYFRIIQFRTTIHALADTFSHSHKHPNVLARSLVFLLTMCLLAKIVNICLYCQERSSTFKIRQQQRRRRRRATMFSARQSSIDSWTYEIERQVHFRNRYVRKRICYIMCVPFQLSH